MHADNAKHCRATCNASKMCVPAHPSSAAAVRFRAQRAIRLSRASSSSSDQEAHDFIDDEDDAHGWGSSSSADDDEKGDEDLDALVRREAEKPKLAKLKKPRSNENCFRTAAGSTAPSGEPLIRVRGKSSPCRMLLRQGLVGKQESAW
jgi:hypothetical protein